MSPRSTCAPPPIAHPSSHLELPSPPALVFGSASSCSFSSTLMCGTISPPILLKRLKRSVMREEAILVHRRDVAGVVPAIAQDLAVFSGRSDIPSSRSARAPAAARSCPSGNGSQRLRIHDPHADARAADGRSCRALRPLAGIALRGNRACSRPRPASTRCNHSLPADGFRSDLQSIGDSLRQFLRARHHVLQAAEIFRRQRRM